MLKILAHDLFLLFDDEFRELGGYCLSAGGGIHSPHLQPTWYVNFHFILLLSTLHGITIEAT